jgi:hypothetical protein
MRVRLRPSRDRAFATGVYKLGSCTVVPGTYEKLPIGVSFNRIGARFVQSQQNSSSYFLFHFDFDDSSGADLALPYEGALCCGA